MLAQGAFLEHQDQELLQGNVEDKAIKERRDTKVCWQVHREGLPQPISLPVHPQPGTHSIESAGNWQGSIIRELCVSWAGLQCWVLLAHEDSLDLGLLG